MWFYCAHAGAFVDEAPSHLSVFSLFESQKVFIGFSSKDEHWNKNDKYYQALLL